MGIFKLNKVFLVQAHPLVAFEYTLSRLNCLDLFHLRHRLKQRRHQILLMGHRAQSILNSLPHHLQFRWWTARLYLLSLSWYYYVLINFLIIFWKRYLIKIYIYRKTEHENENPFRPDEQLYHEVKIKTHFPFILYILGGSNRWNVPTKAVSAFSITRVSCSFASTAPKLTSFNLSACSRSGR